MSFKDQLYELYLNKSDREKFWLIQDSMPTVKETRGKIFMLANFPGNTEAFSRKG